MLCLSLFTAFSLLQYFALFVKLPVKQNYKYKVHIDLVNNMSAGCQTKRKVAEKDYLERP